METVVVWPWITVCVWSSSVPSAPVSLIVSVLLADAPEPAVMMVSVWLDTSCPMPDEPSIQLCAVVVCPLALSVVRLSVITLPLADRFSTCCEKPPALAVVSISNWLMKPAPVVSRLIVVTVELAPATMTVVVWSSFVPAPLMSVSTSVDVPPTVVVLSVWVWLITPVPVASVVVVTLRLVAVITVVVTISPANEPSGLSCLLSIIVVELPPALLGEVVCWTLKSCVSCASVTAATWPVVPLLVV